jgi:hypothetical protein
LDYHSLLNSKFHFLDFFFISASETTILIVSIIILYLFSFLLSGSEVAFFALTSKDINILKTRKQPSYKRIVSLLEQPKILMASMLIANSLVNIGIILISNLLINSWFKEGLFNSLLLSFSVKVLLVSSFIVLFAEVLPKVWATHHKVWFASTSSLAVEIFNSLFYRFSKKFVSYSDDIEKKFSSFNSSDKDEENNIDYAIDLLPENEAGIEEKQILKGIRKFGGISVKQVMRTRLDVSGIESTVSIKEIKKQTEALHYSRLPVYKSSLDEISGILHMKDLLPYLNNAEDFDWHPLIRVPYFVHEQKSIEDLLQEFRSKRIHFAVVVDEFGGTSGIVTLEDILEEVIGEIKDEFDDEENVNKKIDDFNYIFEGKTMINDACKAMKLPLNAFDHIRGDSDSLAGLVLEIAGEFPKIDESFELGEFTFVCLEINKNRIDKVKVIIHPKENNA